MNLTDERRRWWVLAAMGAGGGLIMLDETVVGIALPTIRRELGLTPVASHWVVNAYMLVFAGCAAAGGKLGDIFGFRKLLVIGAFLFGAASLLAGMANSGSVLIGTRAVQGLGAALIFPATVAVVMTVFPKEQRGMAMGVLAAIGTTFLAIGPLFGGILTELVSWRWIFWANVPVVAAIPAIVLAVWQVPAREGKAPSLDSAGLVSLMAGLGLLVFAIMQAADWGWANPFILASLLVGVLMFGVFIRMESKSEAPLVDVGLFRYASFGACVSVLFVGQFCKLALVVFAALFLQEKMKMSPFEAGLALLVSVAAFPFLSAPTGRFADKHGTRLPVLAGLALATVGMAWIGVAAAWDSYLLLLPGLVFWALGMPCCYAPTIRAMANAVPVEMQGQTSGIGVTARLLGGTIGVAVCSMVLSFSASYQAVFLVTAALMLAALLFALYALDK